MNEPLQALLQEHRQLSDTLEKHTLEAYKAVPLAVTIAGAILLLNVRNPGFVGIVVAYGTAFLVVWLGLIHCITCGFGLRLIKLELVINRATNAKPRESIGWYSLVIGETMRYYQGHAVAMSLFGLLGGTVFLASLYMGWLGLRNQLHADVLVCWVLLLIPVAIVAGQLVSMSRVERATCRKKQHLIAEFASLSQSPKNDMCSDGTSQ